MLIVRRELLEMNVIFREQRRFKSLYIHVYLNEKNIRYRRKGFYNKIMKLSIQKEEEFKMVICNLLAFKCSEIYLYIFPFILKGKLENSIMFLKTFPKFQENSKYFS